MRTIEHVLSRFPERAAAVRRLYLKDTHFRAVCEDCALAAWSLRHFEARADAPLRPEVDEYRSLLCELEDEISAYLSKMCDDV